jgi:general secretion pathway protein F
VPELSFVAADVKGRLRTGRRVARGERDLRDALAAEGLLLVEVRSEVLSRQGAALRLSSMLLFSRSMASLLESGLPLTRALGSAGALHGGEAAGFAQALRGEVERGGSLADALERSRYRLPAVFKGMLASAESAGDLPGGFARAAEHLERSDTFRRRLVAACVYPAILLAAGAVSLGVLLVVVLPRFADMLDGAGVALPPRTAMLLGIAGAARDTLPIVGALSVALLIAGSVWTGRASSALPRSRMILALPVVGSLRREMLAGSCGRLVATLLEGGKPLLPTCLTAARDVGDPAFAAALQRVHEEVRRGSPLAAALRKEPLFPPVFVELASVGERAGDVPRFLHAAAAALETRVEDRLQRLVTVLEPALVVVFGAAIAFIALALLQAVYAGAAAP